MDMEIITSCLVNGISNEKKIKAFTEYSTKNDYKNIWVWCGRWLPFGLNFANKLNQSMYNKPLLGTH
jgi:hypothetical protein